MSKEFTHEDGDFEDKYDYSGTPLQLLQHHGEVSPGFYNLTHGDKGYDPNTPDNMRQAAAMLRSITANEDARQLGRTSPTVEEAVGALGTSPKKPKGSKRFPKKEAEAKSKKSSASTKKGGKRKSRRKSRKKKNFKKHYMWNTRGKRYFAKTYKQHRRGVKLGHSHKKPKKKSRKRRR